MLSGYEKTTYRGSRQQLNPQTALPPIQPDFALESSNPRELPTIRDLNFKIPVAFQTTKSGNDIYVNLCPIIVQHPTRGFVELHCFICHGNSKGESEAFLKGCKGMAAHISNKHAQKFNLGSIDSAYVLEHCVRRELQITDVQKITEAIEEGLAPIAARVCSFDDRRIDDTRRTADSIAGHTMIGTTEFPHEFTVQDSESEVSVGDPPFRANDESRHTQNGQHTQNFVLDTKQPSRSTARYLSVCPVIVEHSKRGWVELCCSLCGANCMKHPDRFMSGVRGIARHLSHKHEEDVKDSTKFTLDECVLRELQPHEVENIQKEFQSGKQPIPFRYSTQQVETFTEQGKQHNHSPIDLTGIIPERDSVLGDMTDMPNIEIDSKLAMSQKNAVSTKAGALPDMIDIPKPFQMLDDWPTVVLREDGQWVELRCPECGTNVAGDHFLKGAYGFARHLEMAHPESVDHDGFPSRQRMLLKSRWAVQRCSNWDNAEWSIDDCYRRSVVKIKRPAATTQPKKIEKTMRIKRARSSSTSDERGPITTAFFATFCPCTLSGHRCRAEICSHIELCVVSIYLPITQS
jgi:hypothetical protein